MEEFHAKPLSERKSRRLGPVDYIKDNAWAYLPLASVIAGVGLGVAAKNTRLGESNFFPFNGHVPYTVQAQEWAWKKLFSKGGVDIGEITNAQRLPWIACFSERHAEVAAPHIWNAMKAAEFAGLPFLYLLWRKKESQQLDLQDVSQKMLALPKDIKPTSAELTEENDSLRQQLDFVREQNATPTTQLRAVDAELDGKVKEPIRARAV